MNSENNIYLVDSNKMPMFISHHIITKETHTLFRFFFNVSLFPGSLFLIFVSFTATISSKEFLSPIIFLCHSRYILILLSSVSLDFVKFFYSSRNNRISALQSRQYLEGLPSLSLLSKADVNLFMRYRI